MYRICIEYIKHWNQCAGLPKVETWKQTKKNLILTLTTGEKKTISLNKVYEQAKSL